MIDHEKAFQELKNFLSSAPLLAKPKGGESFFLYLVVMKNTKSIFLIKEQYGAQDLVYYINRSFLDAETRYSHLEKLILSLVRASTKFRQYFETHPICVIFNFRIKNVMRKPKMSGRMDK